MIIGTCILKLTIYESNSLKEKRHTLRSIIERLKSRFNISISEVDLHDLWGNAVIGFACISNSTNHANQTISNVIKFIDGDSRVEIIEHKIEIF